MLIYIKFIGYLDCVFFENACDKLNSSLAERRLPDRPLEKAEQNAPATKQIKARTVRPRLA